MMCLARSGAHCFSGGPSSRPGGKGEASRASHRLGIGPVPIAGDRDIHHILHKNQSDTATAWPPPSNVLFGRHLLPNRHIEADRSRLTGCGGGDIRNDRFNQRQD